MGGRSERPMWEATVRGRSGRLRESEVGGHARQQWEAVRGQGGRPVRGRSGRLCESEVGGHARPKWEAEVRGRSGRPWEAKVGGRVSPRWEAARGRSGRPK